MAKAASPSGQALLSLPGLFFHVFGSDKKVQYQGVVRGMASETHAIVQYFEWVMGADSTIDVVPIATMFPATLNNRALGSWQFYESAEQMNSWYQDRQSL